MSRSAEFVRGQYDHFPPNVRASMYFQDKRYGDRKELPTSGPRRGGPLPYPSTYDMHLAYEDERRRSQSE